MTNKNKCKGKKGYARVNKKVPNEWKVALFARLLLF
jgi:hypothetical protein